MPKKKNTKRKDGRIAVQVYLGLDENKKRKYKTVYGATQKEANAKAEDLKTKLRKGLDITAENDSFEDWGKRWLKVKKIEISKSQGVVYESALNHLYSYIGKAPISKIKTTDIQNIIIDLKEKNPNTCKPSSQKLLKSIKMTASQVFRLAIENRVIDYNPADTVKIPSIQSDNNRRALTAEEQQWILAPTDHRAKRAAMVMMYSGLRKGELIPLTWNDIDFKNKTISVSKAVERDGNTYIVKNSTKTKAGIRTVDVPQVLIDYLKQEKRDSIYVCTSAKGKFHTPSSWTRMWSSYLADLNIKFGDFSRYTNNKKHKSKFDPEGVPFVIPKITPHWLRHTFATMLYNAGVDAITAKEQLGHADIKTTLEIYTHLDKNHKRRNMSKLDAYLQEESEKNNTCKSHASQGD